MEMIEIGRLVQQLETEGKECALYGSFAVGNMWPGSDVNLLAIEPSQEKITSSVTNYILGDWSLDTPRITKMVIDNQLLQIEVFPVSSLAGAADDWILCDRLNTARPIGGLRGELSRTIEYVRSIRSNPAIRNRRVAWYVTTSVRLLQEAGSDPSERILAYRLAAMLLGCAELEVCGQGKGSYKRLYRQCQAAAGQTECRQPFERLYGVEGVDPRALSQLVARGLQVMEEMRKHYGSRSEYVRNCGPGLRESLVSTLAISSGGVPSGKGILENLQIGDLEAALDCLRKATLWLTNAVTKIEAVTAGILPAPGGYLTVLRNLPFARDILPRFFADLFALTDSPDELQNAFETLLRHFSEASCGHQDVTDVPSQITSVKYK